MDNIYIVFLLFIIYAFIGWTIEVFDKLYQKHKFINRGFLIGPICPIYGCGSLAILFLLDNYKDNIIILFFMAVILCSFLEYTTSYVMEKIFKTRWWDYSTYRFNINGRVCLKTMIPFGLLGCFIVKVLNPLLLKAFSYINNDVIKYTAIVLFIALLADTIISYIIIYNFKDTVTNIEKDATEEISKKVKEVFVSKGGLYKRLVNAFPYMKNGKERLLAIKDRINKELEKFK